MKQYLCEKCGKIHSEEFCGLGGILRRQRILAGLTRRQVDSKLHWSSGCLRNFEYGQSKLKSSQIAELKSLYL